MNPDYRTSAIDDVLGRKTLHTSLITLLTPLLLIQNVSSGSNYESGQCPVSGFMLQKRESVKSKCKPVNALNPPLRESLSETFTLLDKLNYHTLSQITSLSGT